MGHICVAAKKLCAGRLQRLKRKKKSLFSSAENSFVRLRLENIVPSSDIRCSENDYLALKI